jgi:hypothetical protein
MTTTDDGDDGKHEDTKGGRRTKTLGEGVRSPRFADAGFFWGSMLMMGRG